MPQQEGVIKFRLDYAEAPPVHGEQIVEINAWRQVLFRLGLVGRDTQRYGGYAFGNVSRRLDGTAAHCRFLVSGTQTGGLAELDSGHYATVLDCDIDANRLSARGPIRPSSEALTHAAVYVCDETVRFVMHAHCPEIWQWAEALRLPTTPAQAAYGTPEMATEVERLFARTDVKARGLFAMGGHEDGIVSFGATAEQAGQALVGCLARALALAADEGGGE
ncbi:MAG: class II aldolase/adducin family protein [Desulfuromonadales bacterium]|nr:class II aldolase/adducin family protein [Desulfuromonadales bacterium]NIR33436.1 class II aldolase/adducin family protein [Desulfuromonadales bacterium]NIS39605.1 class II aldolase/adducin family protein [Desulfuromonadales bacterium]